jgi:hypothetical protein
MTEHVSFKIPSGACICLFTLKGQCILIFKSLATAGNAIVYIYSKSSNMEEFARSMWPTL